MSPRGAWRALDVFSYECFAFHQDRCPKLKPRCLEHALEDRSEGDELEEAERGWPRLRPPAALLLAQPLLVSHLLTELQPCVTRVCNVIIGTL